MIPELISLALRALSNGGPTEGSELACTNPRITVVVPVDPRFRESIAQLCAELDGMRDADRSAHLRIRGVEADILVDASLADGRKATRLVKVPSSLNATVQALVTLPPSLSEPRAVSPMPPSAPLERSSEVALPSSEVVLPTRAGAAEVQPPDRPQRAGIEVGTSVIARISGAPTYLSTGLRAYAGVRPGDWLLALSVRWDPFEFLATGGPTGFEMDSVGAGFVVARRLGSSPSFDLGATASLVEQAQSYTGAGGEVTKENSGVRLGSLARILVGSGTFRSAFSLELEVSPSRLRRGLRLDDPLPMLPAWSVGVGVGGTWEDQ